MLCLYEKTVKTHAGKRRKRENSLFPIRLPTRNNGKGGKQRKRKTVFCRKRAQKRTACAVLLRFIVVILTLRQATSSSITVKVMTEASELRFVTGLNFTTETEPLPRLNTYSPSTSGTDQPVALVERL